MTDTGIISQQFKGKKKKVYKSLWHKHRTTTGAFIVACENGRKLTAVVYQLIHQHNRGQMTTTAASEHIKCLRHLKCQALHEHFTTEVNSAYLLSQ